MYVHQSQGIKPIQLLIQERLPVRYHEYSPKTKSSKKCKATLPAKKNLNDRHSRDKFDWLAENNFSAGDFFLTLTFAMPLTDDEAKKFLNRFITNLRKHYRKLGLELKYLYVTEHGLTEEGEHDRLGRTHFHFLCNSGHEMLSDEEFVELKKFITELWDNGICKISDTYRTKDGLLGLCRYMLKEQRFTDNGKRSWTPSKNLKRPFEVRNDEKISRSQMKKLLEATSEDEVKRLAEKYFKGWSVVDFYISRNEITGLPYASFKLVRKSTLPPNNSDDNLDDLSPLVTETLKERSIL